MCIEESVEKCQANVKESLRLLELLGFLINHEKRDLLPKTRCRFLGFVIDSIEFRIKLTEEKKSRLLESIKTFKTRSTCSIREFAELLGKLVASCLAVEYGWLYTKILERTKIKSLMANDGNYNV